MSKLTVVHTPEIVIAHAVPEEARAVNDVVADGRADYALYVPSLRAQEGWAAAIRAEITGDSRVEECARRIAESRDNPERLLYLVAKAGETVVGVLHAEKQPLEGPDAQEELVRFFVARGVRGRGIGSLLMDRHVDWAEQLPAPRMMLYITQGNLRGERFYDAWGYEPVPGTEHTFEDGIPTRIMERTRRIRPNRRRQRETYRQ